VLLHSCCAQDLAPRAYIITPLHSNAITLSWAFYNGSIDYNGGLPISEATGTYSVPTFSYSCTTFTFSPFAISMVEKLWRNVCQPICF